MAEVPSPIFNHNPTTKRCLPPPSTSGSQTLVSSTPTPETQQPEKEQPETDPELTPEAEPGKEKETKTLAALAKPPETPVPPRPATPVREPTPPPPAPSPCIFLTGATGFLGKVVLEELLRRSGELQINKIIILIRPKNGKGARARLLRELIKSPCFANLSPQWPGLVQVVEGDIVEANCGIEEEIYEEICAEITHVIHCAGTVNFSLPLREAAKHNITGVVNIYNLASDCSDLQRLVVTSSAYVTPHSAQPIQEKCLNLPLAAKDMLMVIEGGNMTEERLLGHTGHPNTYTLTKCIAENYLLERHTEEDEFPITIVRPSIISASKKYPFPGWIDSKAAFAGFVLGIGLGVLRVIDGDSKVMLDIVPVDDVARKLIDEALLRDINEEKKSKVVFSVSTKKFGFEVGTTATAIAEFFNSKKHTRSAKVTYIGPRNFKFKVHDYLHQKLPLLAAKTYSSVRSDEKMREETEKMGALVESINQTFPHFVHHTFDFTPEEEVTAGMDNKAYIQIVCEGVDKHILQPARKG
ncbi:hypothetical protein G7Y89_g2070 [Cudoniella acicularis]|uniref:Fatty acyl-CoA reductase n=1 Tax=Cudoniella acicularis TaxID=354080 RepID=A0A8H4RU14_9HELO|nr:hypothetical protein G7Y89_g2070 [Cudoniella acicularis]